MTRLGKISRNTLLGIFCSLSLGTSIPAEATKQAQIIYINKTGQGESTLNCTDEIREYPMNSFEDIHSQTPTLAFIDKNNTNSFVLVYNYSKLNNNSANLAEGFNTLNGISLFVMNSTFLTGSDTLQISPTSHIQISHIDSDPLKKDKYGSRFNRLRLNMQSYSGFIDMQVWTWNQRINHWTLIQVWDSKSAYNFAMQSEGMRRIWRELFRDTASPAATAPYCYIKTE